MITRFCFVSFVIVLAIVRPDYSQDTPFYNLKVSKFLMGTTVETDVQGPDIATCQKALLAAYQEMTRVENLLSYQITSSEISRINRHAGIKPLKVSQETFEILQRGLKYSEKFNGLFDVTIGVITERWGFSDNAEGEITVHSDSELAVLLPLVDYKKMVLNAADTTVFLKDKGMKIDLGGIAKGYAIDRGVKVLKENGIDQFFLNAGGDIYTSGKKDGKEKWRVGIKHPRRMNQLIARMKLTDFAVATSGDYERFVMIGGKRYHHIIDPRTGMPSSKCQSVTVLAATAEEADAIATCLFVLGPDHLKDNFKSDLPYFIVDGSGGLHYSPSLVSKHDLELVLEERQITTSSNR